MLVNFQIIGEPLVVREALYQVASLLHANPSRFQHLLLSSSSSMHQPGAMLMSAALTSSHRNYAVRRDIADAREFCVCFICPAENVGGVIGKGGGFINQIRQETGATIRVNTSETDEDDCIIVISSKEVMQSFFILYHTKIISYLNRPFLLHVVLRRSISSG